MCLMRIEGVHGIFAKDSQADVILHLKTSKHMKAGCMQTEQT